LQGDGDAFVGRLHSATKLDDLTRSLPFPELEG
jgi:hypothetical protein